jgi:hypothetical protein
VAIAFAVWVAVVGFIELLFTGLEGLGSEFFLISVFGSGLIFAIFISHKANGKNVKSTLLFWIIIAAIVVVGLIIHNLQGRYGTLTNKQLMNYVEKNCTFSFSYGGNIDEGELASPATKYIMLDEKKVYWKNEYQFGVCELSKTIYNYAFQYAADHSYYPNSLTEKEGGLVKRWESDGDIRAVYAFAKTENLGNRAPPHIILIESKDGTVYKMENHRIISYLW